MTVHWIQAMGQEKELPSIVVGSTGCLFYHQSDVLNLQIALQI